MAVELELRERRVGEALDLAGQVAIQPGPADEEVHLVELGLVGDELGGPAAGDGAGEVHLRRPVERVQVAPGVEGLVPGRAH